MGDAQEEARELVSAIDAEGVGLNEREKAFIIDAVERDRQHFSPAEINWLRGIHRRKVLNAPADAEDE